jgi:beta-glucanase (GH16 family)
MTNTWRRRRGTVLAAVLLSTLASLTVPTAAHATPVILFEDDFTGSANASFDTNKWEDFSTATYNSSAAFGSIATGNNETLDGSGHLQIPATTTSGSAIRTKTFGFDEGYVSAWIKMPTQSGYWPAFWTLNNDRDGTDTLPIGENDIMEAYTADTSVYHATGHTWTNNSTDYHGPDNLCGQGASLTSQYNKYSARVESGQISWYFNDQFCGLEYVDTPSHTWGFSPDVTDDNWLILNLAVGGGGNPSAPTQNATMLVDRVEVTEIDSSTPAPPNTGPEDGHAYRIENDCGDLPIRPGPSTGVTEDLYTSTLDTNNSTNMSQKWITNDLGGGEWEFENVYDGKVIDVEGAATANGTTVQYYPANQTDAQAWTLQYVLGGYFKIRSVLAEKPIDVADASPYADARLQLWSDNSFCAQRFKFVPTS